MSVISSTEGLFSLSSTNKGSSSPSLNSAPAENSLRRSLSPEQDSRLIRVDLCSQTDRPSGTPCQEEVDNCTLLTKRPATPLVPTKRAHRRSKDMFQKAITRYGYLFYSGHLRHVLLHSTSKHPVEVSESPKSMPSLLGSPATWLTAEDENSLIQAHHLRQLLFSRIFSFPVVVCLVTLKHVLPKLQSVRFTNADYAVGTLFRVPRWNGPWQLLSDIKYPSLQGQNSNSRFSDQEPGASTVPVQSVQDLINLHRELFRGIKELRIHGVFIPHDYIHRDIMAILPHLPNLHALMIPIRLEDNIAKLLYKSCPSLKTVRTDDYIWPHPAHPARLQSVVLLLTSFSDLRVTFRSQIYGIKRLVKFEQQRYNILIQEERHQPETSGQRTAYENQIVEQMQRSRQQH
ncbi:MAG: hypothetical protein BYD32DRAFT_456790 [Podila humilis]|nr:MAG: hypothetical protein BYD32DRAFT_456790 [Podila humilis]